MNSVARELKSLATGSALASGLVTRALMVAVKEMSFSAVEAPGFSPAK